MSKYFDRQGKPITLMEWARSFEDINLRRVAFHEANGVRVSTVWLGLDHQFGDGPPLIFETMVFGGPHDDETRRYPTEKQALAGHKKMVKLVTES